MNPAWIAFLAVLHASPRIGVVVLSEDHEDAGRVQATILEEIDETPDLVGVGCDELTLDDVLVIETPVIASPTAALLGIKKAEEAYYEVEYEVALRKLDETSSAITRAPATVRSRYYLWRTAALLALKRDDEARIEARNAVDANPNIRVDMSTYPTRVQELVTEAKQSQQLIKVELQVTEETLVWLDSEGVDREFKASPGEHRLQVFAPGCWPVDTTREIRGGGSERPPLVAAATAQERDRLTSLIKTPERETLANFAGDRDLDVLVLAHVSGEIETLIFSRSAGTFTTHTLTSADLVAQHVVAHSPLAAGGTGAYRRPPSIALQAERPSVNWETDMGLSIRQQTLEPEAGAREIEMFPVGLMANAHGYWRAPSGRHTEWGADANLSIGAWPVGGMRLVSAQQPEVNVHGGQVAAVRVGVGYDVLLGNGHYFALRPRLLATLEGSVGSSGGSNPEAVAFPSHLRYAAGAGLIAEGIVADRFKLTAEGSWSPAGHAAQFGTTVGDYVRYTSEYRTAVSLAYRRKRALLGVRLSRNQVDLRYRGLGETALYPRPVDAVRTDVEWGVSATLRLLK